MAQSLPRSYTRAPAPAACVPLAQPGVAPTTQIQTLGFQVQIFPWLQSRGPPNG